MAEELKRNYTVPLRRGFANTPRYYRTKKAISVLKAFLVKHMKSEDIKIGPKLNELVWSRGIKNPPAKVKITATKDKENIVRAEIEGTEYVDFKIAEKVDKNASMKEKIQNTVKEATTKKDKKEEATETKEKESAPKKAPVKKAVEKTETAEITENKETSKAKPKATEAKKEE